MIRAAIRTTAVGLAGLVLAAGLVGSAPAADPPGWKAAPPSVIDPPKNTSLSAWESYKGKTPKPSVDERLADPVLKGAIDVHAHFGPDSYDRQWDAFEIVKMAHDRGMRGLVLKNHWSESAGLAWMARKYAGAPGMEVFGGLVLNAPEGGVNPQAVRYFAEVEGHYGKVVWFPTHDAENEVKYLKETRPYVIVSRNGVLLPQVLQVLDLIAQYKLTLATGHVSSAEMVQIVSEAKKRGIDRIIITHPGLGPQYTDPTLDQMKQVTAMGAYAEVVSTELSVPSLRDKTLAMMKALGAAHCIVSTDSGLVGSKNHPDALVHAAQTLRQAGFTEADLDLMFKANPAKVLGLPPAG
jgi:hypothetical protein